MIPLILLAAAAPAPTADPLQLETRIMAERSAAADGTTRVDLIAPEHVGPGDAVVVVVRYRNAGTLPISSLAIANPVPRHLAYRAGRGPATPELSVDGRIFGPLSGLRVAQPGGGARPAVAADVTHVRWRLSRPLTAGGDGEFAFQAVVR